MSSPSAYPAPAAPLRRDAARNRELVLAAAAQVFADRGLSASVEEVARVAGVGMGTLYRRFPTKDDLVAELVRAALERVLEIAGEAAAVPEGGGLEVFLRRIAVLYAEHRGCLPRLWTPHRHDDLVAEARRRLTLLLSDAQAHGRVRPEAVLTDVTVVLFSLRGVVESTRGAMTPAWERHLEVLLAGLAPAARPLAHPPLSQSEVDALLS